jgi:hypothetical protein
MPRSQTSDTSNLWEVGPNGSASEAAGEGSTEDLHPSSTDKRKDLRSTKPGYPYYGAEHSANPPPFVSTPIPCPDIGLHALVEPEGDERPGYNYTTLIKCAILGSPAKRLTIDEMYEQLMGKFEYYRKNDGKTDKGWKVRCYTSSFHVPHESANNGRLITITVSRILCGIIFRYRLAS